MNIGTRITILMEEEGISRQEFASRLNMNYNTLTGYILNHRVPDCHTLLQMSEALNTSCDYLMGRTNIRHHRDLFYSENEGLLISNFRRLPPDMQQNLLDISKCLYKNYLKESGFWK